MYRRGELLYIILADGFRYRNPYVLLPSTGRAYNRVGLARDRNNENRAQQYRRS